MDTRRTTFIATIVVIALLAVGIGYAYTAITANNGNDADNEYVKLSQSGTGSYKFTDADERIYYDTVNISAERGQTSNNYTYFLSDDSATFKVGDDNYQLVKVGDSFDLDASEVNNATNAALPITFATTGINVSGDWKVLMKVDIPNSEETSTTTVWKIFSAGETSSSWDDTSFSMSSYLDGTTVKYRSVSITIYYGYLATVHATGTAEPAENPFESASIKFTATVDKENNAEVSYNIVATAEQGIALSVTPTGKVGEGVVVTVTLETQGKTFATVSINGGAPEQVTTGTTYEYTVKSTDVSGGNITLAFTTA